MPRTFRPRFVLRHLRLTLGLGLALGLAGCESFDIDKWNPFQEHKTPLNGTRRPVFPEGVPGVDYAAKPAQPSNSNTDLNSLSAAAPGGGAKPAGN